MVHVQVVQDEEHIALGSLDQAGEEVLENPRVQGAFAFDATTSATALVLTEMEALRALDAWRDVDLSGPDACALVPTLQPLCEWDAMRPE
jgi:hypothetical protein